MYLNKHDLKLRRSISIKPLRVILLASFPHSHPVMERMDGGTEEDTREWVLTSHWCER